jgi:epoxyqueuosine reductase
MATFGVRPGDILRPRPFWIGARLAELGELDGWRAVAHYGQLIMEGMPLLEGPPTRDRRHFSSPEEAAAYVKDAARQAGADVAGITSVQPYHQVEGYDEPFPVAIVLGMAMSWEAIRQAPALPAGVETMRVYYELGKTVIRLAEKIRSLGWEAIGHHPLSEAQGGRLLQYVPMAVDAGLAELGRCGFAISPRLGPVFRLAAVTTDLPLAVDEPPLLGYGIAQFCELCTACLRACPTGAVPASKSRVRGVHRWKLDSEACFPQFATHLGCSICMAVCPYSLPKARDTLLLKHWAFTGKDPG